MEVILEENSVVSSIWSKRYKSRGTKRKPFQDNSMEKLKEHASSLGKGNLENLSQKKKECSPFWRQLK